MGDPVCVMVATYLAGFGVAGWLLLALVLRDHGQTFRSVLSERGKRKVLVVLVPLVLVLAPAFGLTVGRGVGEMVARMLTGH